MHVQQAGPEGVVPPDVGPADVQPSEAEIGDPVRARGRGLAPGVVRDTGGEDEAAVGLDLLQGEEIAVARPDWQVRPGVELAGGDRQLTGARRRPRRASRRGRR